MEAAWIILGAVGLVAFAALARVLLDNPRGDVETGVFWHAVRVYSRWMHRLRIEGAANVPDGRDPGPLILVANHASGVDPLLIQGVCPFEIRWMMAEDMRHPAGRLLWTWARVIFVERGGGAEISGVREAIRHVKSGGVLGIFPEGGIERPAHQLLPFLPGVGLIVRSTRARVLPVVVEGTPAVEPAWLALRIPSRARLRFQEPIDYAGSRLDAKGIAEDLRRRYAGWTGWEAVREEPARIEERLPKRATA